MGAVNVLVAVAGEVSLEGECNLRVANVRERNWEILMVKLHTAPPFLIWVSLTLLMSSCDAGDILRTIIASTLFCGR
jgi:hypothetical protein